MQAQILQISYGVSAAAFLVLGALVLGSKSKPLYARALLASAAASVCWSLAVVLNASAWLPLPQLILPGAELVRMISWLLFLGLLVGIGNDDRSILRPSTLVALVAGLAGLVMSAPALPALGSGLLSPESALQLASLGFMGLNVVALLLLENLYRNANMDARWGVKFLCFGIGAVCVYDFAYYADLVLFHRLNSTLYEARGLVNALTVPLIAVAVSRAHAWTIDIHVSRRIVFRSAALVACGVYLLAMSGAGYYVREWGGTWGPALQVAFLCGAALLLFALFSSESFRSRAKHFIVRNFYTAKYDYRREWMRFIGSLSSGSGQKTLQDRIVHAFAEVMDSRGAGLWVLNEAESAFAPTANWNFGDGLPKEPHGSSFVAALGARERLWTVKSVASEAGAASPFVGWLFDSGRASLILPLMHHDRLYAFVVLGTSRVDVAIDDADEELLLVLGRQAASYLAEEKAASALLEAKRWEEMNKRFAFVAHDVKNVVNQLSLLVHNAEAHGRNPAFQADMLATIGASVDRMKLLLQQLRSKRETTQPDSTRIPLDNCLKRIGDNWRTQNSTVNLELGAASVRILGNENRFVSAVDHLMQNAVDAGAGRIVLRSRHAGDKVEVEVEDEGPGMDAGFVRDRLFRPLNSSKHSGFGMGVYQVRQYVRDMGGELIVDSVVGKGTKMCIRLPALAASGAADRPIEPFA